jgi:hypothetical protein
VLQRHIDLRIQFIQFLSDQRGPFLLCAHAAILPEPTAEMKARLLFGQGRRKISETFCLANL